MRAIVTVKIDSHNIALFDFVGNIIQILPSRLLGLIRVLPGNRLRRLNVENLVGLGVDRDFSTTIGTVGQLSRAVDACEDYLAITVAPVAIRVDDGLSVL